MFKLTRIHVKCLPLSKLEASQELRTCGEMRIDSCGFCLLALIHMNIWDLCPSVLQFLAWCLSLQTLYTMFWACNFCYLCSTVDWTKSHFAQLLLSHSSFCDWSYQWGYRTSWTSWKKVKCEPPLHLGGFSVWCYSDLSLWEARVVRVRQSWSPDSHPPFRGQLHTQVKNQRKEIYWMWTQWQEEQRGLVSSKSIACHPDMRFIFK